MALRFVNIKIGTSGSTKKRLTKEGFNKRGASKEVKNNKTGETASKGEM
jgi:hypothetical protein